MHAFERGFLWTRSGVSARRAVTLAALLMLAVVLTGCASGRAFRRGDSAGRNGNWDQAVEEYRRAVQEEPNRTDFKIALERAMLSASLQHLDAARVFEARGQLDEALREYRRASEYDPPNRQIAGKVQEVERRLRDLAEAARPSSSMAQMRETARRSGPPPLLNLETAISGIRFTNTSLRDILNFIGMSTGINVAYDSTYQDRPYTVQLDNVTLQDALTQILTANQLFYKVQNPTTILVVPDNAAKRAQYEEQMVRTFFLSHADATELAQIINTVIRVGGGQVQPMVVANKAANSLVIRATTNTAAIIERIIDANDNPRAEIVVDVQILEVSRNRTKEFGLDLGSYSINAAFSPESDARTGGGGGNNAAGGGNASGETVTSRPFNANTITRGISTADFYLAVPSAVVRFLESDSQTKLIAKPQLRGAEGQKLMLNLGEDIPVPSTTFTPVAQGGANFNPLTSFSYRSVGINVELTPRVTYEDDVVLDLLVESSTLGQGINIAGQNLPSFGSRKVTTRLRLRDGESTLLAGLLREDQRRALKGFPGILRIPIIKQLFSSNDDTINQTDIIMLLTPRIVRTHELTQQDVSPIYIGTQQNLGLGGAPPLIAPQAPATTPEPLAVPAIPGTPGIVTPPPGSARAVVPPGSSVIPGTTILPPQAAPTPAPIPAQPEQPQPSGAPAPLPAAVPPNAGAPPAGLGAGVGGQITVSPPGSEFRVGGGPYTVPISVTDASRLSSVSLTLTYNPAVLRVRGIQEGSFMRAGGAQPAFTQQVDSASGRIDIAIIRPGDVTGVAGTGLLGAVLFDAVAPGPASLAVTGTAAAPGGTALNLAFASVPAVTVR